MLGQSACFLFLIILKASKANRNHCAKVAMKYAGRFILCMLPLIKPMIYPPALNKVHQYKVLDSAIFGVCSKYQAMNTLSKPIPTANVNINFLDDLLLIVIIIYQLYTAELYQI